MGKNLLHITLLEADENTIAKINIYKEDDEIDNKKYILYSFTGEEYSSNGKQYQWR